MSFPWEPRSLERASAACVSYDVLLPAEFDFSRGGRLPGPIGSDGVGQDSFAARMLWRPGGGGAVATRPNKPTACSPFGSTARWLASAAIWCFAPMRRWR